MARSGQIYVIRVSDDTVKVGFSKSPERRAHSLGKLEVVYASDWLDRAELRRIFRNRT